MSLAFNLVTTSIKGLTRVLCQIESDSLGSVPPQGPLILVCNHINFLDAPVMYSHLQPRPLTGFAKSETWDNPVLGPLFTLWGAIPLQRGESDHTALRQAWQALDQGKILAITPEGTRSNDGCLKRGYPGVVTLALHSNAPLLPLVYYGQEGFRSNIRRLKRTAFHIRVGQPFSLAPPPGRLTPMLRQEITDAIMYQLARLLPPDYRGLYGDLGQASMRYLQL